MKVLRIGFVLFFLFAGIYHFVNPELYLGLIPAYIPYPELVNYLSGGVEILIALLAMSNKTRKIAGYAGILLMLAFIPAHIYFIQIGSCIPTGLCVPEWLAYARLFVVHPLIIAWAWSVKTDYLRKEWDME